MGKLLKDLYNGNIRPIENYRPSIEEMKKLRQQKIEHYDNFVKKIGSPLEKEFNDIMNQQLDKSMVDLSDAFIDGFRLGVCMMLEVFEYK